MEWNEKEELKGLLAANKRKPVIHEKKVKRKKKKNKADELLKRNTLEPSLEC